MGFFGDLLKTAAVSVANATLEEMSNKKEKKKEEFYFFKDKISSYIERYNETHGYKDIDSNIEHSEYETLNRLGYFQFWKEIMMEWNELLKNIESIEQSNEEDVYEYIFKRMINSNYGYGEIRGHIAILMILSSIKPHKLAQDPDLGFELFFQISQIKKIDHEIILYEFLEMIYFLVEKRDRVSFGQSGIYPAISEALTVLNLK